MALCPCCKPEDKHSGLGPFVMFSCGHGAHADCMVEKWFLTLCFACRKPLTPEEQKEVLKEFAEHIQTLLESCRSLQAAVADPDDAGTDSSPDAQASSISPR